MVGERRKKKQEKEKKKKRKKKKKKKRKRKKNKSPPPELHILGSALLLPLSSRGTVNRKLGRKTQ